MTRATDEGTETVTGRIRALTATHGHVNLDHTAHEWRLTITVRSGPRGSATHVFTGTDLVSVVGAAWAAWGVRS